jgi:WD40-like Beta Propeller Repeat
MGRVTMLVACVGLGWAGGSLSRPAAAQSSSPRLFAPGVVSTDAPEFAAAFTPDGSEVYFNRASPDRATLTIMTSRRSAAGTWSAPVVASFSGTFRDVDPFVAVDGQRLYFTSDRPRSPGGARTYATWFVERTTSGWGQPVDPGAPLNSTAGDVFFTMARDGTAVFTSSRGSCRKGRRHSRRARGRRP